MYTRHERDEGVVIYIQLATERSTLGVGFIIIVDRVENETNLNSVVSRIIIIINNNLLEKVCGGADTV